MASSSGRVRRNSSEKMSSSSSCHVDPVRVVAAASWPGAVSATIRWAWMRSSCFL